MGCVSVTEQVRGITRAAVAEAAEQQQLNNNSLANLEQNRYLVMYILYFFIKWTRCAKTGLDIFQVEHIVDPGITLGKFSGKINI